MVQRAVAGRHFQTRGLPPAGAAPNAAPAGGWLLPSASAVKGFHCAGSYAFVLGLAELLPPLQALPMPRRYWRPALRWAMRGLAAVPGRTRDDHSGAARQARFGRLPASLRRPRP